MFERAFREYGLPRAIRTDNGIPFASAGIHGLSFLNVWWLRYPGHFLIKKITTGRTFRFHRKVLHLANTLTDQPFGLEETDDRLWAIYFTTLLIATLNERDYILRG